MNVKRLVHRLVDKCDDLLHQLCSNLPAIPIGQARPRPQDDTAVERTRLELRYLRRIAVHPIVLEEQIRRRLMTAKQNIRVVKSPLERPDFHGPGKILLAGNVVLENPAEMRLPEHSRSVARLLEQVADGFLAREELRFVIPEP